MRCIYEHFLNTGWTDNNNLNLLGTQQAGEETPAVVETHAASQLWAPCSEDQQLVFYDTRSLMFYSLNITEC